MQSDGCHLETTSTASSNIGSPLIGRESHHHVMALMVAPFHGLLTPQLRGKLGFQALDFEFGSAIAPAKFQSPQPSSGINALTFGDIYHREFR